MSDSFNFDDNSNLFFIYVGFLEVKHSFRIAFSLSPIIIML